MIFSRNSPNAPDSSRCPFKIPSSLTTQLFILQRSLYNFHFTTFTLQLHSLYNSTHFTTKILNQNEYYSFQNGSVRTFSGTYLPIYKNHCKLCQNVAFSMLIINQLTFRTFNIFGVKYNAIFWRAIWVVKIKRRYCTTPPYYHYIEYNILL